MIATIPDLCIFYFYFMLCRKKMSLRFSAVIFTPCCVLSMEKVDSGFGRFLFNGFSHIFILSTSKCVTNRNGLVGYCDQSNPSLVHPTVSLHHCTINTMIANLKNAEDVMTFSKVKQKSDFKHIRVSPCGLNYILIKCSEPLQKLSAWLRIR